MRAVPHSEELKAKVGPLTVVPKPRPAALLLWQDASALAAVMMMWDTKPHIPVDNVDASQTAITVQFTSSAA